MRFFRITKGLPVGPSKFHHFLFVLLVARFNERCSIAHGPLHFPQFYDRPFDWIGVPLKNGIKPKGITVQTRIVSCIHCSRRLWCDGSHLCRCGGDSCQRRVDADGSSLECRWNSCSTCDQFHGTRLWGIVSDCGRRLGCPIPCARPQRCGFEM